MLVPVSINVSRLHAYDDKLTDTLLRLREEYDVPAGVCSVGTDRERVPGGRGRYVSAAWKACGQQGFLVSMDDFGTGYSTMNMLKNQTLDEIKIDREFIRDLEKDKSRIIIRNTIAMLQQLGSTYRDRREWKHRNRRASFWDAVVQMHKAFCFTVLCRWRRLMHCCCNRNVSYDRTK